MLRVLPQFLWDLLRLFAAKPIDQAGQTRQQPQHSYDVVGSLLVMEYDGTRRQGTGEQTTELGWPYLTSFPRGFHALSLEALRLPDKFLVPLGYEGAFSLPSPFIMSVWTYVCNNCVSKDEAFGYRIAPNSSRGTVSSNHWAKTLRWHGWSAFSKQSRVRSPWDGRPSSHS